MNFTFKIFLLYVLSFFLPFAISFSQTNSDSLLAQLDTSKGKPRVDLLNKLSFKLQSSGEEKAEKFAEEALLISRKENYESGIANALNNKGLLFEMRGNLDKAMEAYLEALALQEKMNNSEGAAAVLNNIGAVYFYQQDFPKAAKYWEESMKIKEQSGNKKEIAQGLINLGAANTRMKKFDESKKMYARALEIFKELDDKKNMASCLSNIGILTHKKEGTGKNALPYYLQAKKINEEINDESGILTSLLNIGVSFAEDKKYSQAIENFNHALFLAKKLNFKAAIRQIYGNLAETYSFAGDFKNAYEFTNLYMAVKDSMLDEKSKKQIAELETKYQTEKKEKEIQRQNIELEKSRIRLYFIGATAFLLLLGAFLLVLFYRQKKQSKDELEKAKSRFYSNIVHEFRTPVALITGPIEQTISETKDEKLKQKLSMPLRNARQVLKLVNQLLDVSKLESGKMKLNEQYGDMKIFLEEILSYFLPFAFEKKITLEFTASEKNYEMFFDADAVEKMVYNLLSNAVKFTPENGKIALTLSFSKDFVFITVKDNGNKIPENEQEKVFDRFYRSANSNSVQGTGIGLALVKELAELHGGKVLLKSNSEGNEFMLHLPFKKSFYAKEKGIENRAEISNTETVDAEPVQILLVEDNRDMREFVSGLLSEKGFFIHTAPDGAIGISKAKELIPDVVITDVMLPAKNGYEVCSEIKNDSLTDHIPVIMLTAKAAAESRLKGLETGADAYLSKPFNPQELIALVNNFLLLRKKMQEKFSVPLPAENKLETTVKEEKKINYETLLKTENIFVKKAIAVIEKHLDDEQFGVEQLSSEMFLSRTQFHRKLKALTGFSANRLIRLVRLEKALELLKKGAGNVTDIAFMTGFGSQPYFTKCFTEHFGFPPKEVGNKVISFNLSNGTLSFCNNFI